MAVPTSLSEVRNVLLVLSGKGGVGKSFVASVMAIALKELGYSVGILDVDIQGPSIPWILGVEEAFMGISIDGKLIPVEVNGIAVASFELLLEHKDRPIVWRGPMKTRAIIEILSRIKWGQRDFLVVDTPPGMSDEHLTIIQLLKPRIMGAILVFSPGKLVEHTMRKARGFLNEVNVELLGAVLNMAYFSCPRCRSVHNLYGDYRSKDIKILAEIPLDPKIAQAISEGKIIEYLYGEGKELLRTFIEVCKIIIAERCK